MTEAFDIPADLPEEAPATPEAPYQPIIKVFREVLKPSVEESKKEPTPNWCIQMIGSYPGITYADMPDVQTRFYVIIDELKAVVEYEISEKPDCLSFGDAKTDMSENRTLYLNLLLKWQEVLLSHELEWDASAPWAAAEVAAISEVHKMFFSQNGITAFLHQAGFEFTEADQSDIAEALDAMRGAERE